MSIITECELRDGIILTDETNPENIAIFNARSFFQVLIGIMCKYGQKSKKEAWSVIKHSSFFQKPITTYLEAVMFSHEYEYHWAMLMSYGHGYWLKEGITEMLPADYFQWEDDYRLKHNLAEESFEFPGKEVE